MKLMNTLFLAALVIFGPTVSTAAFAKDYAHSTSGLGGYDPVAYFTDGSGFHESVFQGVTYVFVSEEHKIPG